MSAIDDLVKQLGRAAELTQELVGDLEITPAMIDAGADEIWLFDHECSDPKEWARRVFCRMLEARSGRKALD